MNQVGMMVVIVSMLVVKVKINPRFALMEVQVIGNAVHD